MPPSRQGPRDVCSRRRILHLLRLETWQLWRRGTRIHGIISRANTVAMDGVSREREGHSCKHNTLTPLCFSKTGLRLIVMLAAGRSSYECLFL